MDRTSKKAIQVAILGTLGCGAIIGLAVLAVIWISAEHDADPAVAAETPVKPDRSDLKSNNEAGGGEASVPLPGEPNDVGGPIHDATDDDVNEWFNALGYGLGGVMPPWMPKYPQVLSHKKLWSSVLTNQSLEEGAQVILCNIHLSNSHLWDPFNSSPDPQLRIMHQNEEILFHRQVGTHHATFSAHQSGFGSGEVISLEIADHDALNKNDYVGSWSFIVDKDARYRHEDPLFESECGFLSPSIVQAEANAITQALDLPSQLSSAVELSEPHLGFPVEQYTHVTRQIEGLAALLGLSDPQVSALLKEDSKFVKDWLAQLLPQMNIAVQTWPRFQDLKVDGWQISLTELSCDSAPFCDLVLTLTSAKAVDLARLYNATPLKVSFFDGLGVEHDMRDPRLYLNGERISDYELRHRSVDIEAGAVIEAHFELDCVTCESQATALREAVQLVRFSMFEQPQSNLVSLRQ